MTKNIGSATSTRVLALLLVAGTCLPSAVGGDLKDKWEATAFGANVFAHVHTNATFGGSLGYGINSKTVLFGEVTHTSGSAFHSYLADVSGGVKYSPWTRERLEPYGIFALGLGHIKASPDSFYSGGNRLGLHAGWGARAYAASWWGAVGEIRWTHYFGKSQGFRNSNGIDAVRYSGGLFVQW